MKTIIRKYFDSKQLSIFITVIAFTVITIFFPAQPVSDYKHYWNASLHFSHYIKGGALIFLYAPFSRLGIPSFIAAFVINLSAFLLMAKVFPKEKLASLSLLFIGLSWSAWSPIVNSDLPSVAFIIMGAFYLIKKKYFYGAFLLTLGLSMRMQSIAVAIFLLIIMAGLSLRFDISKRMLLIFGLSIGLAISVDSMMKFYSIESLEISKSQRVPLYAGLLASDDGINCGEITPYSKEMMVLEQDKPLSKIIRLPENLPNIILCKWSKMLMYSASGSLWLIYDHFDDFLLLIFVTESVSIFLIKIISIYLLITRFEIKPYYLIVLFMFLGYLALHTFLEIQPRYMMPPLTIVVTSLVGLKQNQRINFKSRFHLQAFEQ